jgi:methylglutaconyl-CoA hydratase
MGSLMSETPILLDATREGLAVVTLSRPLLGNAFNPDVVDRLTEVAEELRGADGVRCVILEGAGACFSAGDDVSWARFEADYTRDDHLEDARACAHMLQLWRGLPKPTIALVHGAAIGTGLGLVAACDIVLADRTAFFACNDVKRGFLPAVVAPFLVEVLGDRAARRFMLTGERIEAEEALRLGLVHRLVDEHQDLAQASEIVVSSIFEAAPGAVAATKAVIDQVDREPIDSQLLTEMSKRLADALMDPEAREGYAATLEQRKPGWAL